MGSRGGRHRLRRDTHQQLRMRPGGRRRTGLRAAARAMLTAAVGLLLTGSAAAVLHNSGAGAPTAAFLTTERVE